jgi:hypothetical protein
MASADRATLATWWFVPGGEEAEKLFARLLEHRYDAA